MTAGLPKKLRARAANTALTVPPSICRVDDCNRPTTDHEPMCDPCADSPHPFTQNPSAPPSWCLCGRIEHIGFYSPVHEGLTP